MKFTKWTSIPNFHNLRRELEDNSSFITYAGKIKLHGTNAAILINAHGDVKAQKRTQIITSKNDNIGFARWVEDTVDIWKKVAQKEDLVIFGEWCGKGIQKGVAISKIDNKIFGIFAIKLGDKLIVNPIDIALVIYKATTLNNVYILPYYYSGFTINFSDVDSMQKALDIVNVQVVEVDNCDPWVKQEFNIEGCGEGLVYFPTNTTDITKYIFKAKGEKHKIVKKNKLVLDPEIVKDISEFVELVVLENRLEQGLENFDLLYENIGPFIGWVCKDIAKECQAELEVSGLDWRLCSKAISSKARKWFIERLEVI